MSLDIKTWIRINICGEQKDRILIKISKISNTKINFLIAKTIYKIIILTSTKDNNNFATYNILR